MPSVEVIDVSLSADGELKGGKYEREFGRPSNWSLLCDMYVVPFGEERTTIPFHRCSAFVNLERTLTTSFRISQTRPILVFPRPGRDVPTTLHVESSASEVVFYGPGRIVLEGNYQQEALPELVGTEGDFEIRLSIAEASSDLLITGRLVGSKDYVFKSSVCDVSVISK